MIESNQDKSSQKSSAHANGWADFPIPIIEGLEDQSQAIENPKGESPAQDSSDTYSSKDEELESKDPQKDTNSQTETTDSPDTPHTTSESDEDPQSEEEPKSPHADPQNADPALTTSLVTETEEPTSQVESPHLDPIVHLVNAEIARGDNPILSDVALNIFPGDFIYLVGKVGSGKSTLIETLTGQIPLVKGEGLVCGFDLMRLKSRQIPKLRRSIGVVFQDFKLLTDRNVEKNLIFVLRATGWRDKQQISRRIEEVLTQVGLAHKAYKMPNQLSGGEQQRIAIARAILNNPALILADEPTGNLDPETSEGILFILKGLSESGRSVVMATHNRHLANRYPAPTLRCAHGKLEEISHTRYYEPS